MRFSLSLILFMAMGLQFLVASPLKGQALDDKKITMEATNITLERALVQVEKLSGFRVAFATEKVLRHQRVFMPMGTRSVSATLHSLLTQTGLEYRYSENTIMIVPQPDGAPVVQQKPAVVADTLKPVRGKVLDETGGPMPGVSVRVKGSTRGVYTDGSGAFNLQASTGEVIVFSSIGAIQQEHTVAGNAALSIVLKADNRKLEDVVIVGYGSQKKANLTGAVSTVDVKRSLEARPISDVGRGLQGVVPGLTITSSSGDLGRNPNIRLRGMTGSLNNGGTGTQPLILVDNVEIPSLQMVNPQDIESISVLKDAASTSIYGARAAWGVVLITTKSGKKGAPSAINYSNTLSWSKPTQMPELADAAQWVETVLATTRRTQQNPNLVSLPMLVGMRHDTGSIRKIREWQQQYGDKNLDDEMVEGRDFEIKNGEFYPYRQWDPAKKYLRKYAFLQKHDLSFSGGGEKTQYHLGLGYLNQTGMLNFKTDRFDRYNASLNINSTVNDWMDIRGKMMFSQTELRTPFNFTAATYGPWYYLYRWSRTYPYGTYQGKPFRSAVTELQQANMDKLSSAFQRVQIGTTIRPFKGMTLDVDYTYSSTNTRSHEVGGGTSGIDFWSGSLTYKDNFQPAANNLVRYISSYNNMHTVRAFATYSYDLKENHHFKVLAGMDADLYQRGMHSSERKGMLDQNLGEIPLAIGDQFVGGNAGHWATNGYFGRINYDYRNKYLFEVNARYDGSSWFPRKDQWAFFPSVSAGWVATEENFLKGLQPTLSFLKLRASYGAVGNQKLGSSYSRFIPTISSTNSGWLVGGNNMLTFTVPGLISESLTWETITTLDFGADARFLDNRLGVTFDWYSRKTNDMIGPTVAVPATLGTGAPQLNYGTLETKGWELAIDWSERFENGLGINIMASITDFREQLTKYINPSRNVYGNYQGKMIGEIWGYETDRIFQESDFTVGANGRWEPKGGIPDQSALQKGSAWFYYGPGDVKYVDRNGDGKVDWGGETVDDSGDLYVIGNSTPRYQYSLRVGADWKGIELSVFLQGVGKRDYWAGGPIAIPGFRDTEAWFQYQMDYWTPANTGAYYPRPTNHAQNESIYNFNRQTRYLLDMSYLRVKNLTIGYRLPQSLISKARFKSARVFLTGENLVTFDKLDIPIDPEIDYTTEQTDRATFGRVYPYRKEYSAGVQLTF
ncbi:TonB-dependent receptor [Chitinophaga deserti]|uniref:TonB-dependent receptor n=1 Tax=Chitinophaga deserti TaxID=2164099 RepID=UPI0018E51B91|nr:TonB-dependent receptor [Chitinophaga deserti]